MRRRRLHTGWLRRRLITSPAASPEYPRLSPPPAEEDNGACAPDPFEIDPVCFAAPVDLHVHDVIPLTALSAANVLILAARGAWPQDHAVGRAIVAALPHSVGLPVATAGADGWRLIPGRGFEGPLEGYHLLIGNETLMQDAGFTVAEVIRPALLRHQRAGRICVFVAARMQGRPPAEAHRSLLGVLILSPTDHPRLDSAAPSGTGKPPPTTTSLEPMPRSNPPGAPAPSDSMPSQPAGQQAIESRPRHRKPRGWMVLTLGAVSAAVGLYGSMLRVEANETVVIRRWGRVVGFCSEGTHFRSLWLFERAASLAPLAGRRLHLNLGGPERGPHDRGSSEAAPSERTIMAGPVLACLLLPADPVTTASTEPVIGLLRVSAWIEYSITDPSAYMRFADDPDGWLAVLAESALRELLAAHPRELTDRSVSADDTGQWAQMLNARLSRADSGLSIQRAAILRLEPASGGPDADMSSAAESALSAKAQADSALSQAATHAGGIVADARIAASGWVVRATAEEADHLEHARVQAMDLTSRLTSCGGAPVDARLRLLRAFLNERSSSQRTIIVNPDLGPRCRLSLRRSGSADTVSIWVTATQPAAGRGVDR